MDTCYTGQCGCGAVALEINGAPVATRQCWCRQCQRIAAGGPTNNAMFRTEDVTVRGTLATSGPYEAASGNHVSHLFCPTCGTQVIGINSGRMQFRVVRMGVLDQPHDLAPAMAIWLDDAPRWAVINPAIEQHRRQPPAPPPAAPAQ